MRIPRISCGWWRRVRRDFYQVPFDPNDPNTQGQFLKDANRETDSFVTFSWLHTYSPGLMFTASPFFHSNSANYESSPLDLPSSATERRSSKYEGGQLSISWVKGHNNLRAGLYGFAQQDSQRFGLIYNDNSAPNLDPPDVERPAGSLIAPYIEDQLKVTSWLDSERRHSSNTFFGRLGRKCDKSQRRRIGPRSRS